MNADRTTVFPRILLGAAALLVLKVMIAIVWNYRDYLPPNFRSDFLHGREAYFWNGYHWPFYLHLVSGPLTLILGLLLVSDRLRQRYPTWHRRLGRIQGMLILLLLTPTGLWMAFYTQSGPLAGLGLALLAVSTASCVALGWRAAVQRRFTEHRLWMYRCFLLLCSAVVLRISGGLATVLNYSPPWFDPTAVWLSWLAPIAIYELIRKSRLPYARPLESLSHYRNFSELTSASGPVERVP